MLLLQHRITDFQSISRCIYLLISPLCSRSAWTGAKASPTYSPAAPSARLPNGPPSATAGGFPPLQQQQNGRTERPADKVLQQLTGLTVSFSPFTVFPPTSPQTLRLSRFPSLYLSRSHFIPDVLYPRTSWFRTSIVFGSQRFFGLQGTTITLSTKTGQRYEAVVGSTNGEGDTTGVTLKDVKELNQPGAPLKDTLFIASTNIDTWSSGPANAKAPNGTNGADSTFLFVFVCRFLVFSFVY